MNQKKLGGKFQQRLAPHVSDNEALYHYEPAFRRWLGRELYEGNISTQQAAKQFNIGERNIKRSGKTICLRLYL